MDKRAEGFTISIVDYVPRDAKDVNPIVAFNNFWKIFSIVGKVAIVITIAFMVFGCATTQNHPQNPQQYKTSRATNNALGGALLGGIFHAIKGGDTQEGLAIVGASTVLGYMFGNEKDKKVQQSQYQSNKRVYQSQMNESYSSYGQSGSPKTKWHKNIKRVTKDGKTTETITETGVSTMTEDSYYE